MNPMDPFFELGGQILHHCSGGVAIKETKIPAGIKLEQHKHPYDHLSYLISGLVTVEVNGVERVLQAPASVVIVADQVHSVTAHTEAIWLCIHKTDETDPEKIDVSILTGGGRQ